MKNRYFRWIIILILLAIISYFPLNPAYATSGEQLLNDPYPMLQSDFQIGALTNPAFFLILGAFVIVLVILGAVLLRRSKS